MYKIKSPVPSYSGQGFGLSFINGEAVTDNKRTAAYFRANGYEVIDTLVEAETPQKALTEERREAKDIDTPEPYTRRRR